MRALRNDSVDVYARASDYIDEVVSQIERLQEAGAAYATAGTRAAAAAAGCARSGPRRARASRLTDQAGLRCMHRRLLTPRKPAKTWRRAEHSS